MDLGNGLPDGDEGHGGLCEGLNSTGYGVFPEFFCEHLNYLLDEYSYLVYNFKKVTSLAQKGNIMTKRITIDLELDSDVIYEITKLAEAANITVDSYIESVLKDNANSFETIAPQPSQVRTRRY